MATAAETFRARFENHARTERQSSADERIRTALDLHAFNLLLTIDRVLNRMEGAADAAIMEEVNRRRLASSPMPLALVDRAPRRDATARSN